MRSLAGTAASRRRRTSATPAWLTSRLASMSYRLPCSRYLPSSLTYSAWPPTITSWKPSSGAVEIASIRISGLIARIAWRARSSGVPGLVWTSSTATVSVPAASLSGPSPGACAQADRLAAHRADNSRLRITDMGSARGRIRGKADCRTPRHAAPASLTAWYGWVQSPASAGRQGLRVHARHRAPGGVGHCRETCVPGDRRRRGTGDRLAAGHRFGAGRARVELLEERAVEVGFPGLRGVDREA